MKKWIMRALSVLLIVGIFYLTFQNPKQTHQLSKGLRNLLEIINIHVDNNHLRHYIHYVIYFVLGIVLSLWLKNWRALVTGLLIGILDEVVKIWLSTREFDAGDMARDFVGIVSAWLIMIAFRYVRNWKRE